MPPACLTQNQFMEPAFASLTCRRLVPTKINYDITLFRIGETIINCNNYLKS